MSSIPNDPNVPFSFSSRSPSAALDVRSPAACPGAPPPSPRIMPAPEDVIDGVFRDIPLPPGLTANFAAGMRSFGDPDDELLNHASDLAMARGTTFSDEDHAVVRAAQASPLVPFPKVPRIRVSTSKGEGADAGHDEVAGPAAAHKVSYADCLRRPAAAATAAAAVKYHKPVYGVLLPDAVAQVLAYTSPGTYLQSDGEVVTEQGERLTRDGLPTLLPLATRGVSSVPSTPGAEKLAEMSINDEVNSSVAGGGSATHSLDMLASVAFLASAHYRIDGDDEMDIEEDVVFNSARAGMPVAELDRAQRGSQAHADRPVPGVVMDALEFSSQQQELIRLQLQHDEARAAPAVVRLPKAQFYSRTPATGLLADPALLRGYAPMEVDGYPARREPLAHARIDGSVSSNEDLYAPPPLEENLRDDPPDAPRVQHRYGAIELPGETLPSGEVRYSHDIPIRNSAALSAAIQGASGDIPQMWSCGDHVADARVLAGGSAAPPQNVLLPPLTTLPLFTIIPLSGAPPIHFDDPEMLLKGLAAERVFVIFPAVVSTIVLQYPTNLVHL